MLSRDFVGLAQKIWLGPGTVEFSRLKLKKKVLFIRQAQILSINSVSKNMFKCGQFSRQKT